MKSKKLLTKIGIFVLLTLTVPPININAQQKTSTISEQITRSDIIDWRYKVEDGKLYKRLFNYSKNEWIGDWELCP